MKYFFLLVSAIIFSFSTYAQQSEQLFPLTHNPALSGNFNNHQQKYLIDKGITIVKTDTLHLPFVDDFSRNNLRSYKWIQNHITDTFTNVFGTCLGPEGVTTINATFSQDTAWSYTYDTATHTIDSAAQLPIQFTFFGPSSSACFNQPPSTFYYWNQYYTYTFDSLGRKTDSLLVTANATNIDYAPVIYFAQNENGKLWFDNYAFVNTTYPVLPPTIGVATLDGLNEFGLPYNNSTNQTYGDADYLTSLPINLSGLTEADSVYLSFFYQGGGLGDAPEAQDSLLVEFKDNSGTWRTVWFDTAFAANPSGTDTFRQILVEVNTLVIPLSYFHNMFQFRFRNKAALYGNLDHWHIDYVKLDKNRSAVDTSIFDMAFVYDFPTILKNFTQLPARQLNSPADLADTIHLLVHNLDPNAVNNPPATNFIKGGIATYPVAVVAADVTETFNALPFNFIHVAPTSEYTIATPNDSLHIIADCILQPSDSRALNDSVFRPQNFSSYMAYDDGTAESAYGLTGLGTKKFAYEFNLNYPDTLAGFQIMFAQKEQNVSDLVFNFYVWDSLRMNDFSFVDNPVLELTGKKPYYVDSVNGFVTYVLDTQLLVYGKIYLGWSQTDERNLQIGFDRNSALGRQHMFVNLNSKWNPSTLTTDGSPMIRLILDGDFWGQSTVGIKNMAKEENQLFVYPNPASGILFFRAEEKTFFEISVVNAVGQEVLRGNEVQNQINITSLSTGIYFLEAKTATGKVYRNKFIKSVNP